MIEYSHTQRSPLAPPLAVAMIVAITLVAVLSDGEAVAVGIVLIASALIVLLSLVFGRLTVTVAGGHVRLAFGGGWPAKRIALEDVESARAVRNRWWYGLGIRLIPQGWLWNVWGLDAVELQMRTGRRFRIGTDEPAELVAVLTVR